MKRHSAPAELECLTKRHTAPAELVRVFDETAQLVHWPS